MTQHIACFVGTRPEVIKMAPVVRALDADPFFKVTLIATAQHRALLDEMLAHFRLKPDRDLDCMNQGQDLSELTAALLQKIAPVFKENVFDAILVQGDTTTVMAAALAAFYHRVPIGHIEAGLRTHDLYHPFPEECNRVVVGRIARWHFAPTAVEAVLLCREQVPPKQVYVTGNTVVDAVDMVSKGARPLPIVRDPNKRLILVTAHRRESFGAPLARICQALAQLADQFVETIEIIYPVHPNPQVQSVAARLLSHKSNVHLVAPLSYPNFIACMQHSYCVLSDSGGVQEEATVLGKPILILRDKTERPQTVQSGVGHLVGTELTQIVAETTKLLKDKEAYKKMAKSVCVYGKVGVSTKIAAILKESLQRG